LLNGKRQLCQVYSGRLQVQQYITNSTHKRGRDKANGAMNFDYQCKGITLNQSCVKTRIIKNLNIRRALLL
jgi:hypothetical protein